MHAYLVVGKNSESLEIKCTQIANQNSENTLTYEITKIDEVRKLQEFIQLKIDKPTAIIVNGIDNASLATLNAFLKILEEPQGNLSYILSTSNYHNILPTIKSRCQTVFVEDDYVYDKSLVNEYKTLLGNSVSDKFELFNKYRDRSSALNFLTNFLSFIYLNHKNTPTEKSVQILDRTNNTISALKRNGNVKLQTTNLIINL